MTGREEKFEKMLADTLTLYQDTLTRMDQLRGEGKTRSVRYRELMYHKQEYQNLLRMYQSYGLIDSF